MNLHALFRRRPASILPKYLDAIYSIEKLEKSGTILIDIERPGVALTMEYLTFWNDAYRHYGDDRVLHAWCEKFRALINLRRGHAFGSEGKRLPIIHPTDPIYLTIADPDDPTKPWCIAAETVKDIQFKEL